MQFPINIFENSKGNFDFNTVKQHLEGKVGGDLKDEKAKNTSFEALEKVFSIVPLEMTERKDLPEVNSLIGLLVDKDRIDFLKAYAEKEAKVIVQIADDLKPIVTPKDELNFARTMQAYAQVSERLLKIYNLMSKEQEEVKIAEQAESTDAEPSVEKKMEEIARVTKESLANSYAKIFNIQAKNIESVPETQEGNDRLESLAELLNSLGILSLMKSEVAKKKSKLPKEESVSTKKKKRIITRLLRAIAISQLPAIANDKIEKPGDYFRLFKSLEKENSAWMDLSIEKYVFGGNAKEISEFNSSARNAESAAEENQVNYLRANRSWILSYIKSDKEGVLTDREESNYVSQLETTCTEKEKEIKNYYLSRDFNISNVSGLQLKPEVRLPLYTKVKLAVSEADRLKESPLRNIVGGVVSIVGGIFSQIEDKSDAAVLRAAQARNQAIFKGIGAIVKGAVGVVGGKQAARDFEAGKEKLASTLNPERFSLSYGEKGSKIKEDMISTTDATGFTPVNPEAPGQVMQTPDSMAGTMDTFSLLGPGKKSSDKKKEKSSSKVLTFADFIKSKEKLD